MREELGNPRRSAVTFLVVSCIVFYAVKVLITVLTEFLVECMQLLCKREDVTKQIIQWLFGGFLLGFMGVGIQVAIHQVRLYTSNERCCKKELRSLKESVSIERSQSTVSDGSCRDVHNNNGGFD